MKSRTFERTALAVTAFFTAAAANAVVFSNAQDSIDFPQGISSFADVVADFSPGPGPDAVFLDRNDALGPPDQDFSSGFSCLNFPTAEACRFTSLGTGGSLTVQFTDNFLTGSSASGTADGIDDLFVFEIGEPESTFVEISKNGVDFFSVGNLSGAGGGVSIDIDAFGFGIDDLFSFVRVTDDTGDSDTSPEGADIDAIGAISSMAIPVPAVAWLFPAGLIAGLGWMRRQAS